MRRNENRDITRNWLSEMCHNVEREPPLQPHSGETPSYHIQQTGRRMLELASKQWDSGYGNVHSLT